MIYNLSSFLDELEKLATVTPEQAVAAKENIQQLEKAKPSAGQLARGALVGSAVGTTAGLVSKAIGGNFKKGLKPNARDVAALMASGAIFGSATPVAKYHMEHQANQRKLDEFAHPKPPLVDRVKETLGV